MMTFQVILFLLGAGWKEHLDHFKELLLQKKLGSAGAL